MASPILGEIRIFAGPRLPQGWAFCDGSLLQMKDNEALYSLIGNTYGGDPVKGTFAVPDLRGRLVMGQGSGRGLTPRSTLAQKLGEQLVMLAAADLPPHSHAFSASTNAATSTGPGNSVYAQSTNGFWNYAESSAVSANRVNFAADMLSGPTGSTHPNVMPSFTLNFIIALQGTYPQVDAVAVYSLSSRFGSIAGGGQVTLTGLGFSQNMTVNFGSTAATVISVNTGDPSTAVVTVPPGTGRVPVTVHTSGGSSAPNAGAMFYYTPSVVDIKPSHGSHLGGTLVSITGIGLTGATQVMFGNTPVQPIDSNDTLIRAFSPPGVGIVDVTVTVPGPVTTVAGANTTFCYAADVVSLNPPFGPPSGGTTVNVNGLGFVPDSTVYFGQQKASTTYQSPTLLQAVSPPGAGIVDVTVRRIDDPAGSEMPFDYGPTVTGISPQFGLAGTNVTITGTNFIFSSTVQFGSVPAQVTSQTDTELVVVAPVQTGLTPVIVNTLGGSAETSFNYGPTITGIVPAGGPLSGGTAVTITGTNFAATDSSTPTVMFGTAAATVSQASASEIIAIAPPNPSAQQVNVVVTTPTGSSQASDNTVFTYDLSVTGLLPSSGSPLGSTPVAVAGSGFVAGQTTVNFGSTPATDVVVLNAFSLTCLAPAGRGFVNVTVQVGGATSPTGPKNVFSYMPSVATIAPTTGPIVGGAAVTVTGGGFAKGATTVSFGTTPATNVVVTDEALLTCTAPAGGGKVPVTITTAAGMSPVNAGSWFTYYPSVAELLPNHGDAGGGKLVKVRGAGLSNASSVLFGGTAASNVSSISDTEVQCLSPAGTGPVHVQVVTPGGTTIQTDSDLFQYGPTISELLPDGQWDNKPRTIMVSGQGFTGAEIAYVGDVYVEPTVISDTSLSLPVPGNLNGSQLVYVATRFGKSPSTGSAYYNYPPAILSIGAVFSNKIVAGEAIAIIGLGMTTVPEQVQNWVQFTQGDTEITVKPFWTSSSLKVNMLKAVVPSSLSGQVNVVVANGSWGASAPFPIVVA